MASEFTPDDLNDPELEALAVALRENRPTPRADFATELDDAVADHFPPEWSAGAGSQKKSFSTWLNEHFGSARQMLLPATAGFAGLLIVVVAVGVGMNGDGLGVGGEDTDQATELSSDATVSSSDSTAGSESAAGGVTLNDQVLEGTSGAESAPQSTPRIKELGAARASGPVSASAPGLYAAGTDQRKVAQDVDITLGTDPDSVQDVSNEIVEVVDDHNGIVLDSSVKDGPAGEAGARFSLMIPSEQLESAVGDLSGVADLRARSQETEDITAPTLTVEDSLRDSRARIDSLIKELSESTTDEDRARIEDELAEERRQAARLNTRLNNLERKANLTPVGVTVETGGDTSSGDDSSWGVSDAIDDAGKMLGVSAGVALIALAIAVPIGLMVLIALALNRAWVRHSRRRALDEN